MAIAPEQPAQLEKADDRNPADRELEAMAKEIQKRDQSSFGTAFAKATASPRGRELYAASGRAKAVQ